MARRDREPLAALLRGVRELELVARRNVTSHLRGNYLTTIRGRGTEFWEARRYVPGESARHIDWRITARLREPHVRVHREERQRNVLLAVDTSASMDTGWGERTKLETAIEAAATLAVAATDLGDRLGFLTFADAVLEVAPPRLGRSRLHLVLSSLLRRLHDGAPPGGALSDPRVAIHEIQRLRGQRFVVFLISDLIDLDVPDDLRFIGARHDLSLLHVRDALEERALEGAAPRRPLRAAEGRRRRAAAAPDGSHLAESRGTLRRDAARLRLSHVDLPTSGPVGRALGAFFHRRRAVAG